MTGRPWASIRRCGSSGSTWRPHADPSTGWLRVRHSPDFGEGLPFKVNHPKRGCPSFPVATGHLKLKTLVLSMANGKSFRWVSEFGGAEMQISSSIATWMSGDLPG